MGVLRFTVVRVVLAAAMVLGPAIAARFALVAPLGEVGAALLGAALALGGYALYVRRFERRALDELGGPGALRELAVGAALGAALFAATIGVLALASAYHVVGARGPSALLVPFASAIAAAVVEELAFRAVLFRIVEARLGTRAALAISAAFFGLAHLANPGATVFAAIAIALEAGALLGAAFARTRRLWLALGLHVAWNFTEAGVFGADVSGRRVEGLLVARIEGAAWLTGGAFGPEASVIAVLLCAAAAAALLVGAARRCHLVARRVSDPR